MKYKDITEKYDLTKAEFDQVIKLVDYLNSLKPYSSFEEAMDKAETDEDKAKIAKEASEEFDGSKLKEATYFSNDQVLLFKYLYEHHAGTFVKEDEVITDKSFNELFKGIKDIHQHVKFFKDRTKNDISNEQLNKTVVRFISVNVVKDKYVIEIIPANFLEGLMVSYTKHHMFIEDKDRPLKREIKNLLKNSSLTFDEALYGKIYESFKELLNQ